MFIRDVFFQAASAALFAHTVSGFSNLHHIARHVHANGGENLEKRLLGLPIVGDLPIVGNVLNSNSGPLDLTGDHEWRAPEEGDQRGPCVRLFSFFLSSSSLSLSLSYHQA